MPIDRLIYKKIMELGMDDGFLSISRLNFAKVTSMPEYNKLRTSIILNNENNVIKVLLNPNVPDKEVWFHWNLNGQPIRIKL